MVKIKAFSLIELMVVIAIVALLAAVAVPSYSKYTIKAKIATLVPVIDRNFKKAEMHYIKYGYFPAAGHWGSGDGVGLGYTIPSDWRAVGNASTEISPLLASAWLGYQSASSNCNTYGYYQYVFDPTKFPGSVIIANDNINYFIGAKRTSDIIVIGCDTTIAGVTVAGGDANYYKCQYSYAQAAALACD